MERIKEIIQIFNNVFYLYQLAWRHDRKYLFYLLLQFVFSVIDPFVMIIFPKIILDEILGKGSFLKIILMVSALTGILFVTRNSLAIAKQKGELEGEFLMIQLRLLCNKINMTTAFEDIESPAYLDMRDRAYQIIWNSTYFNTFAFSFVNLISGLLQLVGIFALIINLEWMMIIVLVLLFTINMGYQIIMQKKNYIIDKETSRIRRRWDYLNGVATDFQYGKMIRLEGLSDWLMGKSRENRDAFFKQQKSIIHNNAKVKVLSTIFACLQELGIYAYLIYKVIYDKLTIGSFSMYLAAVNQFSRSLSFILDNSILLNKYSLYMVDFRKFLPICSKDTEKEKVTLDLDSMDKIIIEFKHVFFKYPRTENWILKDINLIISPCEKISLVGDNGAGKTTLIKLLTGLYYPTEGKILLNGRNISEYSFDNYQKIFASVFQDYKTFAFTVGENISMKEIEESETEKITKALEQSGLKEKVENLTNKAETYLGKKFEEEGIELSGGEQQKLSIARALYQNAPVLILDEPTANLSPIAEYDIYKRYYQMTENKAAVFVSHRLSSSMFCDKVILLENGTITEYGSHEVLMELKGNYAKMFQTQAQYYSD